MPPRTHHMLFVIAALVAACAPSRPLDDVVDVEVAEAIEGARGPSGGATAVEVDLERLRRTFAPGGVALWDAPRRVTVASGEDHAIAVELRADRCYAFIGIAAVETLDLDLQLSSPSGWPVAFDDSPDHYPVLPSYCPPEAGTYTLRVSLVRGQGEALVGAWRLGVVGDVVRELGELQREFAPEGRAIGPVEHARLGTDETETFAWSARPHECYAIIARGDETVVDADLMLYGADGVLQQQDVSLGATPVIPRFCSDAGETYRVGLRVAEGEGWVSWQAFEVPPGPILAIPRPEPDEGL